MLFRIRRALFRLVAFKPLFALLTLAGGMISAFIVFGGNSEYDKFLLISVMLTAWGLCLWCVTTGYSFLDTNANVSGAIAKLKFALCRALVYLAEWLFLLTCIALLWLSIRAISYAVFHS